MAVVFRKITCNGTVQGCRIQTSGIGFKDGDFNGTLRFLPPGASTSIVFTQPGPLVGTEDFFPGGCDLTLVNGSKELSIHVQDGNKMAVSLTDGDREIVAAGDPVPVTGLRVSAPSVITNPNPV
jgi:hypothetical protein